MEAVDLLLDSTTIALAPYEIGNALRNDTEITRILTPVEADRILQTTYTVLNYTGLQAPTSAADAQRILATARAHGLTYYDAAYLTAAQDQAILLPTEDKDLTRKARKAGLKVVDSRDFRLANP